MTGDGTASASKAAPKVKPSNFCVQLHSLLENPRDPEAFKWVDGEVDQFQITVDENRGLNALRPNLDFKSMSSFVRQLSYYDFKRLSDRRKSHERRGEARVVVFTHHSGLFTRGNSANVEKMKRKLRIRAERGRRASAVSTGSIDDDHSASGSPLFSPVGTGWPPGDNPPPVPVPSPSFARSFNSGMGSFSLSAPPPPRSGPVTSNTSENRHQSRWQPYNPPEPSPNYLPHGAPSAQASESSEVPRFAPYPHSVASIKHRASIVSIASDSSNLSPRSQSVDLAYYAGSPARPSPTDLVQDYPAGSGTSFSDPFATRPYPSPQAQLSQYFPSSRHPASPSSAVPQPSELPTGLAVAYDQSPSQQVPLPPGIPSYPANTTSSLAQYRSALAASYQSSHLQNSCQSANPYPNPHLGFRNHHRFSSAPTSNPPFPYPQFTPPRTEEYHSPTSVPDEEYVRQAALEARRTSYPFPHPPVMASLPPPTNEYSSLSLGQSQLQHSYAPSPKAYFPTPPLEASLRTEATLGPDNSRQWQEVPNHEFPQTLDQTRMTTELQQHYVDPEPQQPYYDSYPSATTGEESYNPLHHHHDSQSQQQHSQPRLHSHE